MGTKMSTIEISNLMTIYGGQLRLLDAEKPHHTIQVQSFLLQTTEVTQSQWRSVMDTQPWQGQHSFVKEGPLFPAQYVTWNDATEFCERLGKKDGNLYRLPTEAEWEYACKAGSDTMFSFGDDPSEMEDFGWTSENAYSINESYAHRTARRKPNGWGLYDMHGNVWEWCSDRYRLNHDPKEPQIGNERVMRGGSWRDNSFVARSACRLGKDSTQCDMNIGFRVVCEKRKDSAKSN